MNIQSGLNESVKCSLYYSGETLSITSSIQTGMTFHHASPPNLISLRIVKGFPEHDLKLKTGGL